MAARKKRKPSSRRRTYIKRPVRNSLLTKTNKDKKEVKKSVQERLWRLESGITYSALSQWIENPEAFYLNYVEGLTPRKLRKPLEFGSVVHMMLEHQFLGRKKSPKKVADEVAKFYEATRSKTVFATERETLHTLVEVARMIFPHYCDYWKEDDSKLEWVAREQKFRTPYEFSDLNGKKRTIFLRGMRDGVFKDHGIGVFETKTKETIDQEVIRAILKGDMQTLLYLFTAAIDFKETPNQVLYNIIRRPGQHHKNETVTDFCNRIQDDVLKRPEHYFMRWHVDLNQKDLDAFESQTLLPIIRSFVRWADSLKKNRWNSPYHWINLNGLVGKYGKSEYWERIINGRRSTYYRRSSVFPELEEFTL